ncbi:DsrE family protein [Gramella lutea]|uniref:DsrE family protein n=1 Tax=Christiangramia lutea TaxID=1607951 RepID=A0A9X2A9N0_9FLAO|nr:DsrE family protein [Christiangramia lutea]MCH4823510.1 DsrE family protein [Christiangramia lutea]
MNKYFFLLIILFTFSSFSQNLIEGEIIPEYGKTYPVKSPGFKTDTVSKMKVVFDVNRSFAEDEPNKLIETAARYLNMHENAGVSPENMEIALVIHGKAVQDVLKNKPYNERFPDEAVNPNIPLIEALVNNGVQVIVCGQSATHYKVFPENSDDNVSFALSAMTALVQLQNKNYRLIKF